MIVLVNPSNFRYCVLLSVLSERGILIKELNENEEEKGIKESEMKLLKLIQEISNGTKVEVSRDGREVQMHPGVVTNNQGRLVQIDMGTQRALGYYVEVVLLLAIYGKHPLHLHLKGITNDQREPSIEALNATATVLFNRFNSQVQLSAKVLKRAFRQQEHNSDNQQLGLVEVRVDTIKWLNQVDMSGECPLRRVRGIATGANVSSDILNRVIREVKGVLLEYVQDIWVKSDLDKRGVGRGYAVQLQVESVKGMQAVLSVDCTHWHEATPEQVGRTAAECLLEQIINCCQIDSCMQSVAFVLMALAEKKLNKITLSALTPFAVTTLRLIKLFLGVTFHFQQANTTLSTPVPHITLTCLGIGLNNISRIVN